VPLASNIHLQASVAQHRLRRHDREHLHEDSATSNNESRTVSIFALLVLFVSYEVLTFLAYTVHFRLLGAESLSTSWFVDSYVVQTVLVLVSLIFHRQILRLSTLRPKWDDVLWFALGFLVNGLPIPGTQRAEFSHQFNLWAYAMVLVAYGPIVEELFVRGIFLRSLIERFPKIVVILGVSLIWALDHVNFWASLPLQLTLCIVYVCRKNSLSASIACHAGGNLAALVFYSKIV